MAIRISGVNINHNKQAGIALTAIFGIGRQLAISICREAEIDPMFKISQLTEDDLTKLRKEIAKYKVEGDLRREIAINIKRKIDINCYQGKRHKSGLPVHGQRTHTNRKTSKKRGTVRRVGSEGPRASSGAASESA